ncbi:MAG: peptide-methionine (S)-S-oxide reductase MsrA [Bacteroidales bacterium]|nr:peptide-methionine (S)-S-oxide reductase MsrA [Bacteroidales bacterium]
MEKEIYLAGGCFWGAEHYLKKLEGVTFTQTGFANGNTDRPTYKEVYTDTTGYAETVLVRYDPDILSLCFLIEMYFKAIDPLSLNKQGEDSGTRYRTGIYYINKEDGVVAAAALAALQEKVGAPLAVECLPAVYIHFADYA